MNPLFGIGVAKVVEGIGRVGFQPKDLLHLGDGLLEISRLIVDRSQLELELRVLSILLEPPLNDCHSLFSLVLFFVKRPPA